MKEKILSLVTVAFAANAQDVPTEVTPVPVEQTPSSVAEIIANIIVYILGFAAALAVLFIIYGGIRYIVSAGNQTSADTARKVILYAVLGLVIIILSFVIVNFVSTSFVPVITP